MRNVLVYHDSSNLWYASLTLRGFTRFARQQGWRLVSLPRIAASKEPARFRRMVKTMNPVGLFANYTEGLRKVVPGVVPSVWIDCADETILPRTVAMIGTDNVKIAELAAEEFARFRDGRFLCLSVKGEGWSELRAAVFSESLARKGRSCRIVPVPMLAEDPSPAVFEATQLLKREQLPVRIFATCDRLADQVLLAAETLGLRVPEAVSVVGVDNDETICMRTPGGLTSIQPDFEHGGWMAGEALADLIAHPGERGAYDDYGVAGIMRRGSTIVPQGYADRKQVDRAVAFIRANAASRISVKDVIREMGCSRRLGELRFRQATGRTIHETIADVRLENLLVQLRRKHVRVGVLADSCGFGSASAMRIFFQQRMGCSMTAWRARELADAK